jgi:hypothetical protein
LPSCANIFSNSCLTPRASAGARAQNSRKACRLRSRQVVSVSVSPGGAGPARRVAHGDLRGAAPRRMLEIQSGVPEIYRRVRRPALLLARVPIKLSLLSTASSRSACHPITTGERTLRQVRVAPQADIRVPARSTRNCIKCRLPLNAVAGVQRNCHYPPPRRADPVFERLQCRLHYPGLHHLH